MRQALVCTCCCADILHPGLALACGVALPTGVAPRGRPTRCVASIVGDRDAARQPQAVSAARSQPCDFEAAVVAWRGVVDRVGRGFVTFGVLWCLTVARG